MSASNVPKLTITDTGISQPETNQIFSGVLADYSAAFGKDLNTTTVGTPQWVLAAETSQAIALQNAAMAYVLSMFNPATSSGRWQDALGQIYFQTRSMGTPTLVVATCSGAAGVTLPEGVKATDSAGNVYESTAPAVFGINGLVIVEFKNVVSGAIPCSADSLTKIETPVFGWDAITNENSGIVGTDVEDRGAFERRRRETVAANAKGSIEAIGAAVLKLTGVADCYYTQNVENITVEEGATNYPLAPHSVYVCVVGGEDDEIARAIWTKKSDGSNTNGSVLKIVKDESVNYRRPPEYKIKFNRPDLIPISLKITISANANLPSNVVSLIQEAVISSVTGENRLRIASEIFASRFYCPILAVDSNINILGIEMIIGGAQLASALSGIDQLYTLDVNDIEVSIS